MGEILASGSYDSLSERLRQRTIRLWDTQTHQCLQVLRGHESGIWEIAFDAEGKRLASGSFDHTIRMWDLPSGECLQVLRGHTGGIWSLAISADGRTVASGGDRTI